MKQPPAPRAPGQRLRVRKLGRAVRIEYRTRGSKSTRIHLFGRGVRVYVTPANKHLVIAGGALRISGGQIHG